MVLGQAVPSLNVFLLLNHVEGPAALLLLVLDVDVFVVLMNGSFGARDDLGRVVVVLSVESLSCTARAVVFIFKTENFECSSAVHIRIFLEGFDVRLKLIVPIFVNISETHDILEHLIGIGARLILLV